MLKYMVPFALIIAMFACSWALAHDDETPFDEMDSGKRTIAIGIDGMNDDTSLSATVVVPVNVDRIEGWAGGFLQQQTDEGEVISQLLNVHTQLGYNVSDLISINAFGDFLRDKERGIGSQLQVGGFIGIDIYETDMLSVHGGAGNYLENKQARDDLGITDADPNVVRALAYLKLKYGRYSLTNKFSPRIDLSDLQILVEPSAEYSLSDTVSLLAKARIGYETDPIAEGENWFSAYQLQLQTTF